MKFLENLGKELGIKDAKEWLHIKTLEVAERGGMRGLRMK